MSKDGKIQAMADFEEAQKLAPVIETIMREAREAARLGDQARAYQLGMKASGLAREDIAVWLFCAETAPSIEAAIDCLNQANALQPGNILANQTSYRIVKALLEQNPQLKYLDESELNYHVQSSGNFSLLIPKDRSARQAGPFIRQDCFRSSHRWLGLAAIGLLPAGLGALLFAPLAGLSALGVSFSPLSRSERIHGLVLVLLSAGLWLLGLLLGIILLVHFL